MTNCKKEAIEHASKAGVPIQYQWISGGVSWKDLPGFYQEFDWNRCQYRIAPSSQQTLEPEKEDSTPQHKIFSIETQCFLKDTFLNEYLINQRGKLYVHSLKRQLVELDESKYIICKCSGFQNSCGQYLYEGDLVELFVDNKKRLGEVTYSEGKFMIELLHSYEEVDLDIDAIVVGTTLENPEMIVKSVVFCSNCKYMATMYQNAISPGKFVSNVFNKEHTESVAYTHENQKSAYMCFKHFYFTSKKAITPIYIMDSPVFPNEDVIEDCTIKNKDNDCKDYERRKESKGSQRISSEV